MSNIAIKGATTGTGTFTIAAPNSNTDRTLTLPDEAGTVLTSAGVDNFPAGTVLQVQSAVKTDTFSESVTTRLYSGDVTGLTVTITPKSATSKLLVMASVSASNSQSAYRWGYAIFRDGAFSDLVGDAAGTRTRTTVGRIDQITNTAAVDCRSFTGVVDANSTSSTTFSIRILNNEGTTGNVYVNLASSDTSDQVYYTRPASTLTVMEIAQ